MEPSSQGEDGLSPVGLSGESDPEEDDIKDEAGPIYSNLLSEVLLLRHENKAQKEDIIQLEEDKCRLEASLASHSTKSESLQKTISQQKVEIQSLQDSARQLTELHEKKLLLAKQDGQDKIDKLIKQYETASKERDTMVMKYAVGEKAVIDLKKDIQSQEARLKEVVQEKEIQHGKVKAVIAEKARLHKLFDTKHNEVLSLEKEVEKKSDELYKKETKLKLAESKLKSEQESHRETKSKLEKLELKLREAKEETEQVRKDSQAMLRNYQELEEKQTPKERGEGDGQCEDASMLGSEACKKRQQQVMEENTILLVKVQQLEKEQLDYELNRVQMETAMEKEKQIVADLEDKVTELEALKILLVHEQDRVSACQAEVERLQQLNKELQEEMDTCRHREADMLDFTQKLTEKNVQLQSELTGLEARLQQLDSNYTDLKAQESSQSQMITELSSELEREKLLRAEESQLLARHLAEKTKCAETLGQRVEDVEGELVLVKKKHQVTLRELTKEVQTGRKKLEALERSSDAGSIANGSRASSNTSLNNLPAGEQIFPVAVAGLTDLDKQVLVNKMVKIQKKSAKLAEKVEFLEDHAGQLVGELQKKTKIIQNYIMREQTGALASSTMDSNKAALAKHGGIMASVYNSKPVDEAMTLELSLEMNQKLQAVLEDTILKNITLKENMETLGNEIARLTPRPC